MEKAIGVVFILMGLFIIIATSPINQFVPWIIPPIGLIILGFIKI